LQRGAVVQRREDKRRDEAGALQPLQHVARGG
jgi:hypothetical protein